MEPIDWSKPIELMNGEPRDSIYSKNSIWINGGTCDPGFHCDRQGCIGGVQVVRNRKEPYKHRLFLYFSTDGSTLRTLPYRDHSEDRGKETLVWRDENGKTCVEVCMSDDRISKERDAIKAKLEHADARIRRLEACIEDFLELTEVPDANCSCHLAPPCGDCVEYGSIREVRALANALLKERGV